MGYANETGYTPQTFDEIMDDLMTGINDQFGTTYTAETFVGTNWYKFCYRIAQRMQESEIKTSEIFLKLQDYFAFTNETILSPEVTPNGFIQAMNEAGYTASVKAPISEDAGNAFYCVDVDDGDEDYAEMRLEICELIKDYTVAGVITNGTEEETLTLSNGQPFDFKFNLPDYTPILLRLTLTLSRNNQAVIAAPEDTKIALMENIAAEYSLGRDFEPERYFTIADAPWAADILLEYSVDAGENWLTEIFEAEYDDLLTFDLGDITLVEE